MVYTIKNPKANIRPYLKINRGLACLGKVAQTRGEEDEEIIRSPEHKQEGFEWVDIGDRESDSDLSVGAALLGFFDTCLDRCLHEFKIRLVTRKMPSS